MMMARVVMIVMVTVNNDNADEHKNDGDDDDDGYLNSVKSCFKNKQIVSENL